MQTSSVKHTASGVVRPNSSIKCTVIIPAYNCASFLAETLDSVIPQCGPNDEVIVIDDGSTDDTPRVAKAYLASGLKYYRRENSGGPAGPRNYGIEKSTGDLIFLFDSDDIMLPGKIEATVNAALRFPNAGMYFTNFKTIDEAGQPLQRRLLDGYKATAPHATSEKPALLSAELAYRLMTAENYVGTSGVAISREVFRRVGGFDETLSNGDDRDMWFRIMKHNDVVYIPQELHCYRIRKNSISGSANPRKIQSRITVLARQLRGATDPTTVRRLEHLLAENHRAQARQLQSEGKPQESRSHIYAALRHELQLATFKLLIRSYVPLRTIQMLKKLQSFGTR